MKKPIKLLKKPWKMQLMKLANAIDEEIARAVAQGIDEAAVTAGWEAYFEVLAAGGTAEEASAKAYETCGSACDNY